MIDDLPKRVRVELSPLEDIVWQGSPQRQRILFKPWIYVILAILLMCFFWYASGPIEQSMKPINIYMKFLAGWFSVVLIYSFFKYWKGQTQQLYLLTRERLILYWPGHFGGFRQFTKDNLWALRLQNDNSLGTIELLLKPKKLIWGESVLMEPIFFHYNRLFDLPCAREAALVIHSTLNLDGPEPS